MANKFLSFLGLAESGDVVVESHRNKRRRTDYMKKIQRLVVPDDEEETEAAAAGGGADSVEEELSFGGAVSERVEEAPMDEEPERPEENDDRRLAGSSRSFSSRLRRFGESLRRQDDAEQPLVLIKRGAAGMLDDIENALVQGQTVLLDFEKEDRKTASDVARRAADFVRMHNGAFYTVTSTSLLLSLNKNSVVEWLPEENGRED